MKPDAMVQCTHLEKNWSLATCLRLVKQTETYGIFAQRGGVLFLPFWAEYLQKLDAFPTLSIRFNEVELSPFVIIACGQLVTGIR